MSQACERLNGLAMHELNAHSAPMFTRNEAQLKASAQTQRRLRLTQGFVRRRRHTPAHGPRIQADQAGDEEQQSEDEIQQRCHQ
mgnify:CR=1 FL=1